MTVDTAITVAYTWAGDELIAAQENHARVHLSRVHRGGVLLLGVMLILVGLVSYLGSGWSIPAVLWPLVGLYILFIRKFTKRAAIRRQFKRRTGRSTEVVYTLGNDDFHIKTPDTDFNSKWSYIGSVRKTRNGFLLYPSEGMFYWLPFHAFSEDGQREAAETLLREKVKDFKP